MQGPGADPLEALVLDLLEWIGPTERPYAEVIDAWRTSCPRLPIWEEADSRGLLERIRRPGQEPQVALSTLGLALLHRRLARPA